VNSQHPEGDQTPAAEGTEGAVEDKRVAARRRFLKMGAGGSTAMVVTIMHKRAFASTVKKGAIVSACVSLQGYPDIKGMNQKKALQLSPMGTPKGVVCNPKPKTNQCVANTPSTYYDGNGQRVLVVEGSKLSKGCGNFDDTMFFQRDYRLYELGYCPVKINPNGDLVYEAGLVYYDKDDKCKVGQTDPKKGVCVGIGTDKKGDPITFWQRTCE